jgi:2-polyprenyl-6-methoxyphenol hydroxylase-like FAD-dependent oxidoreductase
VAASPCTYIDLPQSYLEPLLVRKATDQGVSLHFSTTFLSYTKSDAGYILSTVKDNLTQKEFQIRSRFLCGADGGRSQVAREMKVEFDTAPGGAQACNVIFEADCDHLVAGREAQLSWCVGAPSQRRFGVISCLRMVRPWKQWWLGLVEGPDGTGKSFKNMKKDDPELLKLIRELIGRDDVPVKIQSMDPWRLRESVAKTFHDGHNVFIVSNPWVSLRTYTLNALVAWRCRTQTYTFVWVS